MYCRALLLLFLLVLPGLESPAWSAPDRRNALVVLDDSSVFRPGAEISIHFSLPAPKASFALLRADMAELTRAMLGQGRGNVDLSNAPVVRSWNEAADKDNPGNFNRPVTFKAPEPGIYVVEARWGEQPGQAQYRPFLCTATDLVAKRAGNRLAVWVLDETTRRPVPGALVHARFPQAPRVEEHTDAMGLAVLALPRADQQSQPCVVSALSGPQWTVARVDTFGAAPRPAARTFLWLDRAQYTPGERWRIYGIARDARGRPFGGAAWIRLFDPDGKVIHDRRVPADAYGVFADEGGLAEKLPLGPYQVVAEVNGAQAAAPFVLFPPASNPIQVRLRSAGAAPDHDPVILLEANQPLGEPVRRARVRYRAYPTQPGGVVGPELARYRWLVGDPPLQLQLWNPLVRGQAVTDSLGGATLQLERARLPVDQPYLVAATVTDGYGRSAQGTLYVDGRAPAPPETQLAAQKRVVRAEAGRRRAAAPPPAAEPAPGDPALRLTLDREEYAPGDTARLAVHSGMEPTWGLLTLEGEALHSAQVVQLRKGDQQLRLPLADGAAAGEAGSGPPLRLAQAELIALDPNGGVRRAAQLLFVQPGRQALRVTLSPGRESGQRAAARRDVLEFDVLTADAQGRPVAARVLAGLEARPEGGMPEPFLADARRALFPALGLWVTTRSPRWGLSEQDPFPWLRASGGEGLPAAAAGTGPAGSAVLITTDERGRGRLRVPYGGSLVGLSVVARAAAASGAVGQAELPLDAWGPVALRLHLPARLFRGDLILARAELENRTDLPQAVSLRWSAEGFRSPAVQPALLPLPPRARVWFDIPVQAVRPGQHLLRATLDNGQAVASDWAALEVVDDISVAANPAGGAPARTLRRALIREGRPVMLPVEGSVAPGEEIEVRLAIPTAGRPAGLRVVEPLSDAFAVVQAPVVEGIRPRRTGEGLEWEWTAAPRAGTETLSYRLRALSPGEVTLGSTRLYAAAVPLGAGAATRLAVVPLAAPKLIWGESTGSTLQLRYEVRRPFAGQFAAELQVRVRDGAGRTLAEGSVPARLDGGEPDVARELTVTLPRLAPAQVPTAAVEARLVGSGIASLGSLSVPLARLRAESETRLAAALGEPVTRVLGQSELVAGAPAAVRVIAHSSRGARPLADAAVRISFRPKTAEKIAAAKPFLLAQGKTDGTGTLAARFVVPEAARGEGELVVECASALGEETVVRAARIQDQVQLLLTTDKPIYQPGQRIHLRGLALKKPDLKPLAGAPVVLEVSDPKGNRVFKQRGQTSPYGVVGAEFQLADEVNLGNYVVRAIARPADGPELTVEKTLEVKKYLLPKFKIEIGSERPYYLPGERLKGTLKAAYFFGKPVAGAAVELKCSTFVTGFEEFAKIQGRTDAAGQFVFEQELPNQFVGQPIQAGNAVLLLEAAVTDTADHRETRAHSLTIAKDPIQAVVVPESGTLAPNLENRVYLLASYPDGRPAAGARFRLAGPGLPERGLDGQADAHGMAQVAITPQPAAPGSPGLPMQVEVADNQGNRASQAITVRAGDRMDGLLLRADRSIYEVGQQAALEVFSTGARGTVYLDVVRNRQTVLTQTIEVREGRGRLVVPLGEDTAGTLEFRAYRILPEGEMVRDTRIAYVNPAGDLTVTARAERETHAPGEKGAIAFTVNDRQGHPVMAALGVNIVDESVFALQELQPGLEKVYFTLEKELLQPRYEIHWNSPGQGIFLEGGAGKPDGAAEGGRQALARVMFAAVEMAHDYSLAASTGEDRAGAARRRAERVRDQLQNVLLNGTLMQERDVFFKQHQQLPEESEGLGFYTGPNRPLKPAEARDPWGQPFVLRVDGPDPDGTVPFTVVSPGADGELDTADDVSADGQAYFWSFVPNSARSQESLLGRNNVYLFYDAPRDYGLASELRGLGVVNGAFGGNGIDRFGRAGGLGGFGGGFGGGGMGGADARMRLPLGAAGPAGDRLLAEQAERLKDAAAPAPATTAPVDNAGVQPAVKPVRVREFFPETLYSNPAVVTDEQGRARVELELADSITTWRITALANSQGGQLGSVTAPLRVFQDFFVDLDLPVALTQNDEVQLPVAVYNYLPGPQRVRLRLQLGDEDPRPSTNGARPGAPAAAADSQPWFEMVGGDATEKFVDLAKDQVSVVHFRIRARRPGVHALAVYAYGTRFSDAIRRQVEVVPDGKEVRETVNDRLEKTTSATVTIPAAAIPGSARVLVKIYPGIFSQLVEGLDAIFQMPNGCFEQTTSTTYPNVLALDYLKRTKKANPAVQLKAEGYINAGYQRLLTFQQDDGGFSLWSEGQPETFLTAFGIMEMADMSQVYEVDPAVIQRAQKWLVAQQRADGSWPVSASAHQERASKSGILAFTAYATWALAETNRGRGGDLTTPIQRGAQYVKDHLDETKDPYVLALMANALVAIDRNDATAQRVVQALVDRAKEDDKVASWDSPSGTSFTEARDRMADIETTALAAYAVIRSARHGALVNKALTYLIRNKDGNGTWQTTQATILALRALIAATGASLEDNRGTVTVLMNGKEAQKIEITPDNSDVLQQVDLGDAATAGANRVELRVEGRLSALYQVIGRYYLPWDQVPAPAAARQPLNIEVRYDKTDLKMDDTITANVQLDYTGDQPTGAVLVDLGIPPGFQVMAEDLAEARGSGLVQRFDLTGRQVIVYLNRMERGKPVAFSYRLRAKFPIRAKTPRSQVYDYYSPDLRAVAPPVEITVRP
jgi:uncharacterized protein YfaS (alpha-2-macroglobulin family)